MTCFMSRWTHLLSRVILLYLGLLPGTTSTLTTATTFGFVNLVNFPQLLGTFSVVP